MCERDLNPIATAVRHATAGTGTNVVTIPPAPNGSRRRRALICIAIPVRKLVAYSAAPDQPSSTARPRMRPARRSSSVACTPSSGRVSMLVGAITPLRASAISRPISSSEPT